MTSAKTFFRASFRSTAFSPTTSSTKTRRMRSTGATSAPSTPITKPTWTWSASLRFSTCAQRPGLVVQVENRRDADQVHVGFVIGVEGADVAPVERVLRVFVGEVVGENAVLRNDAR